MKSFGKLSEADRRREEPPVDPLPPPPGDAHHLEVRDHPKAEARNYPVTNYCDMLDAEH